LTDTKASRLHAWIAYENHRHVLYDAQSTNGTAVNGKAVESHCLQAGAKISIGATVLIYEVI
jgi:pSer/pThr/pTyr-binding forkhead associated (FHA) protein